MERRSTRPKVAWAGVAIVCLAVLGFVYTVDSASFDGTRWEVATAATRQGFTPTQVGGGFEWLGYHRQHGPQYRWEGAAKSAQQLGFAPPCVTVVINPPHPNGKKVVASATSSAISRKDVLIVARRNGRPCGPGKGAPADDDSKPIAHATHP